MAKQDQHQGRSIPHSETLQSRRWQDTRRLVIAMYDRCHLCGRVVDKALPWPHPLSPAVDHVVPRALGGAMYDMDNLRLAHFKCNNAKGKRQRAPARRRTRRRW